MTQWAPHPFHMGIHHPTHFQFSSPQLVPAICRSHAQNAASQWRHKIQTGSWQEIKNRKWKISISSFFLLVSLLFQLHRKELQSLTLMLTVERGFPKQPACANREVSLCSQCPSSPLPFKRMLPRRLRLRNQNPTRWDFCCELEPRVILFHDHSCNRENQKRKTPNKMTPREIFPLCQDLIAL